MLMARNVRSIITFITSYQLPSLNVPLQSSSLPQYYHSIPFLTVSPQATIAFNFPTPFFFFLPSSLLLHIPQSDMSIIHDSFSSLPSFTFLLAHPRNLICLSSLIASSFCLRLPSSLLSFVSSYADPLHSTQRLTHHPQNPPKTNPKHPQPHPQTPHPPDQAPSQKQLTASRPTVQTLPGAA